MITTHRSTRCNSCLYCCRCQWRNASSNDHRIIDQLVRSPPTGDWAAELSPELNILLCFRAVTSREAAASLVELNLRLVMRPGRPGDSQSNRFKYGLV